MILVGKSHPQPSKQRIRLFMAAIHGPDRAVRMFALAAGRRATRKGEGAKKRCASARTRENKSQFFQIHSIKMPRIVCTYEEAEEAMSDDPDFADLGDEEPSDGESLGDESASDSEDDGSDDNSFIAREDDLSSNSSDDWSEPSESDNEVPKVISANKKQRM